MHKLFSLCLSHAVWMSMWETLLYQTACFNTGVCLHHTREQRVPPATALFYFFLHQEAFSESLKIFLGRAEPAKAEAITHYRGGDTISLPLPFVTFIFPLVYFDNTLQ